MQKKNPYYSFKNYLIEHYGTPYYRIPIDLALSCPHKKSKIDGCIFCAEDGARAVHLSKHLDLKQQVDNGIKYAETRYNANGNYIAYFQSYTNTNADVNTLEQLYDEVLSYADFKIAIISTRPDCLSDKILKLLDSINKKYDLWIELGVQTSNNETLKKINRGHTFAAVENAVNQLHNLKIKTVAHIILGLPDENYNNYINTIDALNQLPFTAYKIHHLLLLKNSPLALAYNKANLSARNGDIFIPAIGKINLLNEFEYAGILIDLIRRIPANRPLLRLTADAVDTNLIGPKWNLSKGQFLELIKSTMLENGFYQGDLYQRKDNSEKLKITNNTIQKSNYKTLTTNNQSPKLFHSNLVEDKNRTAKAVNSNNPSINNKQLTTNNYTSPLSYLKVKTDDNSFTFYSPKYKENYHSLAGAESESLQKFLIPSKLEEKLIKYKKLNLLDIGFGLGYNAVSAIKMSIKLNTHLSITTLEMDKNTIRMGQTLFAAETLEYNILSSLDKTSEWKDENNSIKFILGDARNSILQITDKFDIIFLDAFSPQKNPELWSYDFIKQLSNKMSENSIIVTYSSAFPVRGALFKCVLHVGETKPFGRRKGGTIASKNKADIENPLSEKDLNVVLKSTAGIPFRDPHLNWSAKKIFNYKDKLSKRLRASGIPKWYKQFIAPTITNLKNFPAFLIQVQAMEHQQRESFNISLKQQ